MRRSRRSRNVSCLVPVSAADSLRLKMSSCQYIFFNCVARSLARRSGRRARASPHLRRSNVQRHMHDYVFENWNLFLCTVGVTTELGKFCRIQYLFSTVLSALGARKVSTKCPKWKFLPRALYARAFSFRASRTRALRTDWTSSVSYSLQTGTQHAEESKEDYHDDTRGAIVAAREAL